MAGVGPKYAWKGKGKAGVGTMQIMVTTPHRNWNSAGIQQTDEG